MVYISTMSPGLKEFWVQQRFVDASIYDNIYKLIQTNAYVTEHNNLPYAH